jgi:ribosome recycling factor
MTTIATTKDAMAAARTRMEKAVDDFRKDIGTLRTGRANASILDAIRVDYHGTPMPVNQLGTVTVPEATLLVISPWDPSVVPLIDKAIRTSDLGLNPTNDGKVVRVPMPSPTEERRKEIVKHLHKVLENHRTGEGQKDQPGRTETGARGAGKDFPRGDEEGRGPFRSQRKRDHGD